MKPLTRRTAIIAPVAVSCLPQHRASARDSDAPADTGDAHVTATEDLMREHGVLNRLMLVYEAALAPHIPPEGGIHDVLHGAASLIRTFIEDYHGALEEQFLFPEFVRLRTHADLVNTLLDQHRVGRVLTDFILRHVTEEGLARETTRADVTRACRDFIRMFRAHEAWEDTELFPAFRRLASPERLRALGEQFEEIEHQRFGKNGFAETLAQVERLEHRVGIRDLDVFTAREDSSASP